MTQTAAQQAAGAGSRDGDRPDVSCRVLLIGAGDLAEEVRGALDATGAEVYRLKEPGDREVAHALREGHVDRVAIVSREDPFVLRMALMVRSVSDDVPLLVTIFDPTIAGQLAEHVGHVTVASLAEIVAPSLAGPCLGNDLASVRADVEPPVGLRETEDGVEDVPLAVPRRRRMWALTQALFRPYDRSAALMLFGAIGLVVVLLLETVGSVIVLEESGRDAFYGAAKTLVTVGPNEKITDGPKGFKIFISVTMLCGLVFTAFFTAGIVNRLIDRRLTGLFGRRAVPRRDHVVVVGLGQVGLQLCVLLRRCGIGVVAVENDADVETVGMARELGLPVVIGRGGDPSLLRGLSLTRACALAAVTSDDLGNIAVAMAARSVNPDLRIVLRAGDGRLANETRSLFRIGIVRDVHRLAAVILAAKAIGRDEGRVVCHGEKAHLLLDDGTLEPAAIEAAV